MRLSELCRRCGLAPPPGSVDVDPDIAGVGHDSRRIAPGDLFVAWVGDRFDGRRFVPQAIERGAVAVVAPGPALAAGGECPVPWLEADDPRRLLAPLAAEVYGHPDRELTLVGVTGTNGKSTVATLVAAMLDRAGFPAGFIGTTGYRLRGAAFPGERTTPEASDLFRTLRRMRDAGAEAVAMEVSSHALEQGRVAGAQFDVAVFTNLSRDHLDFHPDMEAYFAAKAKLFEQLKPGGRGVVNLDDAWGRRLAERDPSLWTFGEGATIAVAASTLSRHGIRATIDAPRGPFEVETPLLGRYNLDNLLAAVAAAEALALPRPALAAALAAARPIPGRLDPVELGQPFPVLVDYAHTPAALEAAIRSVKELVPGRTIVVFGCGGERDPGKRPLMGRVAGSLADLSIATSDNPRGEDPIAILVAIEEGLAASGGAYLSIADRRAAIDKAIELADEGSIVLVAGKGHEREQEIDGRKLPFSDVLEIERALTERYGALLSE